MKFRVLCFLEDVFRRRSTNSAPNARYVRRVSVSAYYFQFVVCVICDQVPGRYLFYFFLFPRFPRRFFRRGVNDGREARAVAMVNSVARAATVYCPLVNGVVVRYGGRLLRHVFVLEVCYVIVYRNSSIRWTGRVTGLRIVDNRCVSFPVKRGTFMDFTYASMGGEGSKGFTVFMYCAMKFMYFTRVDCHLQDGFA